MTPEDFYKNHRGGSGAVILVFAIPDDKSLDTRHGIFGSIEQAEQWRNSLGDHVTCVYSPFIVDDPDWGNEAR